MLVTFDTQQVVKELRNHGFTEEQAEALTSIQKRVINEFMDNSLATKEYINVLDSRCRSSDLSDKIIFIRSNK